eukprot:GILJ01014853.1.p1 GENE.GILJ01014853.1~~GILJ01014853.1.p1  ORF type:complete len:1329 (-),score=380.14 GILJ01014853.1:105-3752(-)
MSNLGPLKSVSLGPKPLHTKSPSPIGLKKDGVNTPPWSQSPVLGNALSTPKSSDAMRKPKTLATFNSDDSNDDETATSSSKRRSQLGGAFERERDSASESEKTKAKHKSEIEELERSLKMDKEEAERRWRLQKEEMQRSFELQREDLQKKFAWDIQDQQRSLDREKDEAERKAKRQMEDEVERKKREWMKAEEEKEAKERERYKEEVARRLDSEMNKLRDELRRSREQELHSQIAQWRKETEETEKEKLNRDMKQRLSQWARETEEAERQKYQIEMDQKLNEWKETKRKEFERERDALESRFTAELDDEASRVKEQLKNQLRASGIDPSDPQMQSDLSTQMNDWRSRKEEEMKQKMSEAEAELDSRFKSEQRSKEANLRTQMSSEVESTRRKLVQDMERQLQELRTANEKKLREEQERLQQETEAQMKRSQQERERLELEYQSNLDRWKQELDRREAAERAALEKERSERLSVLQSQLAAMDAANRVDSASDSNDQRQKQLTEALNRHAAELDSKTAELLRTQKELAEKRRELEMQQTSSARTLKDASDQVQRLKQQIETKNRNIEEAKISPRRDSETETRIGEMHREIEDLKRSLTFAMNNVTVQNQSHGSLLNQISQSFAGLMANQQTAHTPSSSSSGRNLNQLSVRTRVLEKTDETVVEDLLEARTGRLERSERLVEQERESIEREYRRKKEEAKRRMDDDLEKFRREENAKMEKEKFEIANREVKLLEKERQDLQERRRRVLEEEEAILNRERQRRLDSLRTQSEKELERFRLDLERRYQEEEAEQRRILQERRLRQLRQEAEEAKRWRTSAEWEGGFYAAPSYHMPPRPLPVPSEPPPESYPREAWRDPTTRELNQVRLESPNISQLPRADVASAAPVPNNDIQRPQRFNGEGKTSSPTFGRMRSSESDESSHHPTLTRTKKQQYWKSTIVTEQAMLSKAKHSLRQQRHQLKKLQEVLESDRTDWKQDMKILNHELKRNPRSTSQVAERRELLQTVKRILDSRARKLNDNIRELKSAEGYIIQRETALLKLTPKADLHDKLIAESDANQQRIRDRIGSVSALDADESESIQQMEEDLQREFTSLDSGSDISMVAPSITEKVDPNDYLAPESIPAAFTERAVHDKEFMSRWNHVIRPLRSAAGSRNVYPISSDPQLEHRLGIFQRYLSRWAEQRDRARSILIQHSSWLRSMKLEMSRYAQTRTSSRPLNYY